MKAWGDKALDSFKGEGFPDAESLEQGTILPVGNPWYWDPEQLAGAERTASNACSTRSSFSPNCRPSSTPATSRPSAPPATRASCSARTGRPDCAFSHFANLYTDYEVGTIDRHNYFGGGKKGDKGAVNNASMLARAGSGSFSSGLQQVIDRPFMLSEWIHCFPNEWGVEGPAIIGAYGFGLQGWDASYLFQNGDSGGFSRALGGTTWDVMAPQILGVFPAVARQVLRGDVKEAAPLAVRNVHVPSLFAGKIGFDDKVKQGYDDKELDSTKVPARALAVARSVVAFTPTYQETPVFDLRPFEQDGYLVSATGQLRWKEGREGFFTMDTDATKAVVGFANGQTCTLTGVTIKPESRFAAIYVTAPGRNETIVTAKSLLIVAIARARNTGMQFNDAGDRLLAKGQAPVLLEPVKATLTIPGKSRVVLLDHDGQRTDKTLPVVNGAFTIDGARDKTPYYLAE